MPGNLIAILFALASALTIAWGTVARHRIARSSPADGSLKGSTLWYAINRPLWWAGTSIALLGYALQTVALGFGTLLVVQPILVLSLMFTLPLSAKYDGRRISPGEMSWAGLLTAAVAVLVILGRPVAGDPHPPIEEWTPGLIIGGLGVSIIIAAGRFLHLPAKFRALVLGIATGAIFGYVAVFSKAVVDIFTHQGLWALATTWETYALIGGAILGTAVQQYSFQGGALKNSLPAMTIAEPIVAFSLGYAILGESFSVTSVLGWIAMALALLVMILSTVALTRRSVVEEEKEGAED